MRAGATHRSRTWSPLDVKPFGYLRAWCPSRSAEREAGLHRVTSLLWQLTGPDLRDGPTSDQRIGPSLRPNIEDTLLRRI